MARSLSAICLRILEVIRQHPEGISEGEIRAKLNVPAEEQANFGRRRRELNYHYIIDKKRVGSAVLYVYRGPRETPRDSSNINPRLRAQALHSARGRCGMCGRSIEKHSIVLEVDHKIPREWGGKTEADNLWAICEECNRGKKNYFESVDAKWMSKVMTEKSVHVRLGETLKVFAGKEVSSDTLQFVANQDDWKKRVRELRYLGWRIGCANKKQPNGRVKSYYRLIHPEPWPEDPTSTIRKYERDRASRNKAHESPH